MKSSALNVLLVEDNPGDARLVIEMLSEARNRQFIVAHVVNLKAAEECLSSQDFDVLLLDLMLNDRSRLSTLLRIHEQAKRLPTVVLTGMDDRTVENWAFHEGAHDYLVKDGLEAAALIESIDCAIEEHAHRMSLEARRPTSTMSPGWTSVTAEGIRSTPSHQRTASRRVSTVDEECLERV
jgi:CheY-like chemotaxis protein